MIQPLSQLIYLSDGSSGFKISPFKIPEDSLIITTVRLIFASCKYGVDGRRNNNAEGYPEESTREITIADL